MGSLPHRSRLCFGEETNRAERPRQGYEFGRRGAAELGQYAISEGLGLPLEVHDEFSPDSLHHTALWAWLCGSESEQVHQVVEIDLGTFYRIRQSPRRPPGGDTGADLAGCTHHAALRQRGEHAPDARFRRTLDERYGESERGNPAGVRLQ